MAESGKMMTLSTTCCVKACGNMVPPVTSPLDLPALRNRGGDAHIEEMLILRSSSSGHLFRTDSSEIQEHRDRRPPVGAEPVTPRACADMMSSFPTGVAVVTSLPGSGDPQGMTCSSLISVTLAPPTLLVSLKSTSPVLAAIQGCGAFAVNLLHSGAERTARVFSSPIPERFQHVKWEPSPIFGLPLIPEDSLAVAECEVKETHEVGDHFLTLGEVKYIGLFPRQDPLLHGMRMFTSWSV